ncbi:unnamed protein product [Moneuplotes crassus]|uniref:RING-type domain-containing protein n=1 Tax=Euplotes crassus TaxID=5936 RepID=A0AAD1XH86_EUPCR|nr:unnamed protein product [Moneuplotes crassus]
MCCVKELCEEYSEWRNRVENYTYKRRVLLAVQYLFCAICSVLSFTAALVLDAKAEDEEDWRWYSMISLVVADLIIMTVMLLYTTILHRRFKNGLKILSYYSNVVISAVWIGVLAYSWEDFFATDERGAKGKKIFLLIYLIHTPRVLITSCIIVFYLVFSPCILRRILKKRRQRIRIMELIRRSRSEDSLDGILPEDPNDAPKTIFFHCLSESKIKISISMLSQEETQFGEDAASWNFSWIMGFSQILKKNYNRLRRYIYEDLRQELDYEECSICIESFSETPHELLIALPCNFQEDNNQDNIHAFHESCILEWLRNQRECPLCRSRITKDDILRYNPEEEIRNDQ